MRTNFFLLHFLLMRLLVILSVSELSKYPSFCVCKPPCQPGIGSWLPQVCDGVSNLRNYLSLYSSEKCKVVVGFEVLEILAVPRRYLCKITQFAANCWPPDYHTFVGREPRVSETVDLSGCPNPIISTVCVHHITKTTLCECLPVMFCVLKKRNYELK